MLSGPPGTASADIRPEDAHVQAVGVLAKAQQTADRYVADAQEYSREMAEDARRRDEIIAGTRTHAARILNEAHAEASRAAAAVPVPPEPADAAERQELQAELACLRTFSDVCRTHLRAYLEALVRNADEWERSGRRSLASMRAELPRLAWPRQRHGSRRPADTTGKVIMGTGAEVSVYDAIGGEAALTAVVDDFYARVLADPGIAGFFAGVNMPRLKGRQVEFFAAALGGPQAYTGPTMREAHRGHGIGQRHFDLVAGHLSAALLAAGVPGETADQIMSVVAPLAKDIVSSASF